MLRKDCIKLGLYAREDSSIAEIYTKTFNFAYERCKAHTQTSLSRGDEWGVPWGILQQWFGLSDAAMEVTLYDLPLYRVFSGTDVFEDQRSAALEGVDAAFGYGRRCRADQRAEFDPEPAQGGRPRNASDQERPAGVLWDESAHRRGRRLWPCAPVRGTAAHVQALHPR